MQIKIKHLALFFRYIQFGRIYKWQKPLKRLKVKLIDIFLSFSWSRACFLSFLLLSCSLLSIPTSEVEFKHRISSPVFSPGYSPGTPTGLTWRSLGISHSISLSIEYPGENPEKDIWGLNSTSEDMALDCALGMTWPRIWVRMWARMDWGKGAVIRMLAPLINQVQITIISSA